jgi:hypothetical protein
MHTGLQVNDEIGDSSGEPTVTGISGTEDESIDIPTQILQNINSTGASTNYVCQKYVCKLSTCVNAYKIQLRCLPCLGLICIGDLNSVS